MSESKQPGPADPLAPEAMDLFDAYQPSLAAGSYRLLLQQTVTLGSSETHHYYRDQSFTVVGPRFALDPAEIHSAFPPSGAAGDFSQDLPYLVLRGRALPWERRIDGNADERLPWMALLILNDAEYQNAGGARILTSTTIKAFLDTPAKSRPTLPDIAEDPQTPLQILDLPAPTFAALVPNREDLRRLAHLRRVNMFAKPLEGNPGEGSYAIVLGNRFCLPGVTHVFLVSLEGWGDVLDGRRDFAAADRTRLVCLTSWSFTNQGGNHTFGGLARGLSLATVGARPRTDGPKVDPMLIAAYASLNSGAEGEDPQPVWYRGPFAPVPVSALPTDLLEERTMPDQVPDITYRAAWQLGRLLALAAPAFSTGLRSFLEVCRDSVEAAKRIETFLDLHREKPAEPPSESFNLAFELVEWLARLLLLYPVPFHYLLPDTRQLPAEALRFFHLDDNWLTALADGALSSAVHSRADVEAGAGIRFRGALSNIVLRHRLKQQGRPVPPDISADFLTAPKTGFLLRSSLVSDWPGLEVDVELLEPPQPGLPSLLRLDHLGNGVLLGLARGRIKRLVLKQPGEGLRFGVDAVGNLAPRQLDTLAAANCPPLEKVPETLRREPGQVLNIAKLAGVLSGRLGIDPANFGSAALAIQLIRAPESQPIVWSHEPKNS